MLLTTHTLNNLIMPYGTKFGQANRVNSTMTLLGVDLTLPVEVNFNGLTQAQLQ